MNTRVFIFMLSSLFVFPSLTRAKDQPWTFWAKTEKKDVPDTEYPGKPEVDPGDAVKKKRAVEEDLRKHVQEALAKADLTTEQGRRDWEKKHQEVRQKRMEEMKEEKRSKTEETRKLQGQALNQKKKRVQDEAASPKPLPEAPPAPRVKVLEVLPSGQVEER